jgi:hypothetical protein
MDVLVARMRYDRRYGDIGQKICGLETAWQAKA